MKAVGQNGKEAFHRTMNLIQQSLEGRGEALVVTLANVQSQTQKLFGPLFTRLTHEAFVANPLLTRTFLPRVAH